MFLYHQKLYDNKVFKTLLKEVCCLDNFSLGTLSPPQWGGGLWGHAGNKSYVLNPVPERGNRRLRPDEADKIDPLG